MSTATDVERARPQPDHTAAPWDVREEILRENNLFRAFERVRDNDYADGDPRPGLLRFERSVATRLGEIRNALAAGAYRPAPLTAIDLTDAHTLPVFDPVAHLIYAAGRDQVSTVWIAGETVVRSRQLTSQVARACVHDVVARTRLWHNRIVETLPGGVRLDGA